MPPKETAKFLLRSFKGDVAEALREFSTWPRLDPILTEDYCKEVIDLLEKKMTRH